MTCIGLSAKVTGQILLSAVQDGEQVIAKKPNPNQKNLAVPVLRSLSLSPVSPDIVARNLLDFFLPNTEVK